MARDYSERREPQECAETAAEYMRLTAEALGDAATLLEMSNGYTPGSLEMVKATRADADKVGDKLSTIAYRLKGSTPRSHATESAEADLIARSCGYATAALQKLKEAVWSLGDQETERATEFRAAVNEVKEHGLKSVIEQLVVLRLQFSDEDWSGGGDRDERQYTLHESIASRRSRGSGTTDGGGAMGSFLEPSDETISLATPEGEPRFEAIEIDIRDEDEDGIQLGE